MRQGYNSIILQVVMNVSYYCGIILASFKSSVCSIFLGAKKKNDRI